MHLWTGLVLGLYMLVVGVSGAILVFQDELTPAPLFTIPIGKRPGLTFREIVGRVSTAYPNAELAELSWPREKAPYYAASIKTSDNRSFTVYVEPTTGQIARDPEPRWLDWMLNLHFNLLAGRIGYILNGIGAAFLLVLCASGIVIWWPGIKRWKHGLSVNFKGSWKRINRDLHRAVGFWTLTLLSVWAVSGVSFVWPKQFSAAVNKISSVAATHPPTFIVPPRSKKPWPTVEEIVHQAQVTSPAARLSSVDFPSRSRDALAIYMARGNMADFTRMDVVYLDPST